MKQEWLEAPAQVVPAPTAVAASPVVSAPSTPVESSVEEAPAPAETMVAPEGDVVESPLVGGGLFGRWTR